MAQAHRSHGRFESAAAGLLYLALALLLIGRGLIGHFTTAYVGNGSDPPMFMWYLRWWRYALDNRIDPFLTDLVWAPAGFNLAWSTFVPLPAWIAMPIGRIAGETAAYNLLCIAALAAAALSAFALCRRITGAFWPSILGGYLFGFSPYLLAQVLAHLHMIAVFPVPLIVLVTLRRLDGETSARRFALELAGLLAIEFLCAIELFATITVFGVLALAAAFAIFGAGERDRLVRLAGPIAMGYAIAAAILSPYLYHLFAFGFPHHPIFSPARFSADLANLLVPTEVNLLGTPGFALAITRHFSGLIYEDTAYVGLPLLVIAELYRRQSWRSTGGKFLIAMTAMVWIAAMGQSVHLAGRMLVAMPWALVARMPLLESALPVRFTLYLDLLIAVIAASWFAQDRTRPAVKYLAAAAVIGSFFPNPRASFWTTPLSIPPFFTDGTCQKTLKPREIILPLPFGPKSNCMLWQERSGMYFRMAAGWTGITPFEFERMPITRLVYGAIDLPEAADQFKAYVSRFGVTTIVADPSDKHWKIWERALASLGPPERVGGVAVYPVPPGVLSAYANLPLAAVEARAIALRLDLLLEAADKYAGGGRDLSALTPRALADAKLLPGDWEVDRTPDAYTYTDWEIGTVGRDQIGILVSGSQEALAPLIDRYSRYGARMYSSAPKLLSPGAAPDRESTQLLLLSFDRAGLRAAAAALKSSPPPERTTPFIAGVMAWRPSSQ